MTPFETLIRELGSVMDLSLKPDSHESCRLAFSENLVIQIDLGTNADQILIGCELGQINPSPYRDKIFITALKANGQAKKPRGILSFSPKKNALILFQFLSLADLTGEKLFLFLQVFTDHARIWIEALNKAEIPSFEEENRPPQDALYGLR